MYLTEVTLTNEFKAELRHGILMSVSSVMSERRGGICGRKVGCIEQRRGLWWCSNEAVIHQPGGQQREGMCGKTLG